MANDKEINEDELKKEIEKILENANLAKMSTKKVRQKLEKKFDKDLSKQKAIIDKLVMDFVSSKTEADEEESEEEEEEDDEPVKPPPSKKKKTTKGGGGGGGGKGGKGYTRSYKLSPALAELMGADEMPRHKVVKKVWAIIKEKNLYDPNNKQFTICDESLLKVFGTKRFRTFGMMKYLKTHFLDD